MISYILFSIKRFKRSARQSGLTIDWVEWIPHYIPTGDAGRIFSAYRFTPEMEYNRPRALRQ
jgi:hypothetical protein